MAYDQHIAYLLISSALFLPPFACTRVGYDQNNRLAERGLNKAIGVTVICYSCGGGLARKCLKLDLFSDVRLQTDEPCLLWNLLTPNVVIEWPLVSRDQHAGGVI